MRLKQFLALLAALAALAVAAVPAAGMGDYDQEESLPDSTDTPCLAIDLDEESPYNRACDDLPHFKSSFINRVLTFNGAVDYFVDDEDHELSITIDEIEKLPGRFRRQDDELLDQDATVLVSERARVYGPDNTLVDAHLLDEAEYVKVRGRLLAPRKWRANEDGDVVPTLRAKRVYVTEWVAGGGSLDEDDEDDYLDDEESDDGCDDAAAVIKPGNYDPCE